MKNLAAFFSLLTLVLFAPAQTGKALLLGNSYTYVNNLPELISMMMNSSGEDFNYQMIAPGGCTFQQHCMVSTIFTGHNPVYISWNGLLDENTATIAKNCTKAVVYDSLWKWTFDTDTTNSDHTAIMEGNIYDRSGIILGGQSQNSFDTDVSFLKAGNYILSVNSNSNRITNCSR